MALTIGAQTTTQGARRLGIRTASLLTVGLVAVSVFPVSLLSAAEPSPKVLAVQDAPPSDDLRQAERLRLPPPVVQELAPEPASPVLDPGVASPEPRQPVADPSVELPSPAVPGPSASKREADVREVLVLVNEERTAAGIAPLTMHPQLIEAALAHAADQYDFDCLTTLTHTGTDGSNPAKRITRTGLLVRTWGENIACNHRTPAEVMRGWMNSPGHRQNILRESFTHIGISITVDSDGHPYWMQVFGTPL